MTLGVVKNPHKKRKQFKFTKKKEKVALKLIVLNIIGRMQLLYDYLWLVFKLKSFNFMVCYNIRRNIFVCMCDILVKIMCLLCFQADK